MPRYLLDLPDAAEPLEFDPRLPPTQRRDMAYWGGVLRAMEADLARDDMAVVLTYDCRTLPLYGPRVVAIVLGDEGGRIPRYTDRVAAVFKCYGTRPSLGTAPLADRSLVGLTALAQTSVRWLRWLPGAAVFASGAAGRIGRGRGAPRLPDAIPLGTFNQLDVPWQTPDARDIDVFFAGSLDHRRARGRRVISAKTRARHEMLAAVRRLQRARSDLRIEIRLTADFGSSEHASATAYSQAMMSSRICLAPRGTSVETFRLCEGLRCGCVVACDPLPPRWFYTGGPFVEVARWSALDRVLAPLLDDRAALQRAHEQSLRWWHERCSEAAVGRFLAQRLNGSG